MKKLISKKALEYHLSKNGNTKKSLAKLGVSWPPVRGWKKQLVNGTYSKFKVPKKPKRNKTTDEFKNRVLNNERKSIKLSNSQSKQMNFVELKFRKILIEYGIEHEWQKPFSDYERWVCVDFYLPKFNVVIELDGRHHLKEKNADYDSKRTKYLIMDHKVKRVDRILNTDLLHDEDYIRRLVLNNYLHR